MIYLVYLLAAIGATGNPSSSQDVASPPPLSRPDPKPRGNPGNWATSNDYPSVALQQEIEGTSGFSLTVGPDGRVSDCVITQSSGSPELDATTCTNVKRRARFEPALDASGTPTTGKYANRIRWQIPRVVPEISFPRGPEMQGTAWARILPSDFPQKALAEKRQGIVKIELAISSVGAVAACKILESSRHADLDAKSCEIALNKAKFGPALDFSGQPTPGRVQTEFNWRIPGVGSTQPLPVIPIPPTLPKESRPKAGTTTVSFIVAADGSLTECQGQTTMDIKGFTPEAPCNAKIKMEPYTDANDKKVARRVVIKTNIEIEDVK
ncbi:energy transducer TonB [Sphingorhabdus sp.]|uniref:energy transducer TonB n=1 Tax=Sphingorhabdus sp. TaxID=1902408 RepID=UPI0037C6248D